MTIKNIENGKDVTGVLQRGDRGRTYQLILDRLSPDELAQIRVGLDDRIEGTNIQTASWIPGNNWEGTPYFALYQNGARLDHELSAKMFGIMVWEAFERHPGEWYTTRFSAGGEEDRFRVYFRKDEQTH